jgi:hypothetical protein
MKDMRAARILTTKPSQGRRNQRRAAIFGKQHPAGPQGAQIDARAAHSGQLLPNFDFSDRGPDH